MKEEEEIGRDRKRGGAAHPRREASRPQPACTADGRRRAGNKLRIEQLQTASPTCSGRDERARSAEDERTKRGRRGEERGEERGEGDGREPRRAGQLSRRAAKARVPRGGALQFKPKKANTNHDAPGKPCFGGQTAEHVSCAAGEPSSPRKSCSGVWDYNAKQDRI